MQRATVAGPTLEAPTIGPRLWRRAGVKRNLWPRGVSARGVNRRAPQLRCFLPGPVKTIRTRLNNMGAARSFTLAGFPT